MSAPNRQRKRTTDELRVRQALDRVKARFHAVQAILERDLAQLHARVDTLLGNRQVSDDEESACSMEDAGDKEAGSCIEEAQEEDDPCGEPTANLSYEEGEEQRSLQEEPQGGDPTPTTPSNEEAKEDGNLQEDHPYGDLEKLFYPVTTASDEAPKIALQHPQGYPVEEKPEQESQVGSESSITPHDGRDEEELKHPIIKSQAAQNDEDKAQLEALMQQHGIQKLLQVLQASGLGKLAPPSIASDTPTTSDSFPVERWPFASSGEKNYPVTRQSFLKAVDYNIMDSNEMRRIASLKGNPPAGSAPKQGSSSTSDAAAETKGSVPTKMEASSSQDESATAWSSFPSRHMVIYCGLCNYFSISRETIQKAHGNVGVNWKLLNLIPDHPCSNWPNPRTGKTCSICEFQNIREHLWIRHDARLNAAFKAPIGLTSVPVDMRVSIEQARQYQNVDLKWAGF